MSLSGESGVEEQAFVVAKVVQRQGKVCKDREESHAIRSLRDLTRGSGC